MDKKTLTRILTAVSEGGCSVDEAIDKLRHFPSESLDSACIDHQRELRTGIPEVVFGESKTEEQIRSIVRAMLNKPGPVLVTRISAEKAEAIMAEFDQFAYRQDAGMLVFKPPVETPKKTRGKVLVLCAGTSDIPVAEEAAITVECLDNPVDRLYDTGVAGLHRLLSKQHLLYEARVIIVVAGMEGALPSVVAGLVSCPVIAVPTSVGYGASFNGLAALLGMLNSCAPGVAVVNIDNGFGAACLADSINRV